MNAIAEWLVAPLQYEFMIKAVLMSAFVGLVCAVLSCYMTLKGWALMGDAVAHSVTPGVVLAYILNLPFALGAFVFGVGSVLAIGFIKSKTRIKEDTVIGLVFTGFFALGLVLISKNPTNVDLMHILFGNVLGIPTSDLIQTFVIGSFTLITVLILRKDLLLFCFDPTHARSIGLNITALYYILLTLLSLTIVVALQAVGVILVVAMLITPGAIAYLLSDRFDRMMLIAMFFGVVSSILGTYISFHLDASTGGCIVVLQTLLFVATMIFAPKHGLLVRMFQKSSVA
ncbi:metal ABC transporter permease [Microcoleus sp. FACHB-1515]|uniref:metal ABC transporter permease n=1 Tax=Cyanophyceae TaxID=3028117 RepID=UPI001686ACA3|nr:metal ABC transporter permease [Microcoleus sp. FACHB-1515]MBD2088629.1 metal ABC transporter permease [Microcoleus sp. FACHB-1515]